MKILQINKFYYIRGGAERYMFELSNVLEKAGHEVIPFSMKSENNFKSPYDKYFFDEVDMEKFSIRNIIKIFYNYDAVRRLKKLIKTEKPDVAHLHNIYYQVSPAVIKVLKKHNIKVVLTMHDYFMLCANYQLYQNGKMCSACLDGSLWTTVRSKCIKNSYLKSLLAYLEFKYNHDWLRYYDLVDQFIAPSEFMKKMCVDFGMKESRIVVLNNFIDPVTEYGETSRDYLLYYGRISEEKGLASLVKAYAASSKKLPLYIVGEGEYMPVLRKNIMEKGLLDKIILTGSKKGAELEKIIQNAKAVIIPSIWPENMPYVLLESLIRGKLVIASRMGGMSELIKNGENGLLFRAGDSEELRDLLEDVFVGQFLEIEKRAKNRTKSLSSVRHLSVLSEIYRHN